VIFIQVYRISILKREAKLQEETYKQKLVEAELKNLKMKFQPHFIFNSLHSISATAYKDPVTADSMISKLSELLRHSINSAEDNFTSVEEELLLSRKYIELQKLRFGERIDYNEKVDQIALKEKIPLFVIQPLLENCIKHAVELTDECISINTKVELKDRKLEIDITNSLPKNVKASDKSLGEGMQNLRDRLNYIYDGKHKLEAGNKTQDEFSVNILLPVNDQK
jgi:sensor histidine kinase YesM